MNKTNAEMLKIVIEYAVERGYQSKYYSIEVFGDPYMIWGWYKSSHKDVTKHDTLVVEEILFDKSFAKAIFGEELNYGRDLKLWEHHLQQAVVSDNPILYYYNFVTERREE